MDEYPNGTNAVVAVLNYTGFDMEDAMILNKSSYERGFTRHASVYKTFKVDIKDEAERAGSDTKGDKPRMKFANRKDSGRMSASRYSSENKRNDEVLYPSLGEDGLPEVGTWVKEGDPLYCVVDELTGRDRPGKHKEKESAYPFLLPFPPFSYQFKIVIICLLFKKVFMQQEQTYGIIVDLTLSSFYLSS
jgi:DNA-directed RNA polymerase I subunit RPA2